MDVGCEQIEHWSCSNSYSSVYHSQIYKLSLQKIYQGEGWMFCSGHVNQTNVDWCIPKEHCLKEQAQPKVGLNSKPMQRLRSSVRDTDLVSQEASFCTTCQLPVTFMYLSTVRKLCSVWNKNKRIGQRLSEQASPYSSVSFQVEKGLCFWT